MRPAEKQSAGKEVDWARNRPSGWFFSKMLRTSEVLLLLLCSSVHQLLFKTFLKGRSDGSSKRLPGSEIVSVWLVGSFGPA